ncbi:hypothetical protein [Streptomyces sp. A0958]|uniref:hypothetical protein n=1 Tax=Streptomyces sp. A0958 TaxID=2563101 RepID=UPI0014468D37|nr:hypothetical protein [Streptomyces sp. A0958]
MDLVERTVRVPAPAGAGARTGFHAAPAHGTRPGAPVLAGSGPRAGQDSSK